jgi:hypothetical protein
VICTPMLLPEAILAPKPSTAREPYRTENSQWLPSYDERLAQLPMMSGIHGHGIAALSSKPPALSKKFPLGTMGGTRDTRPPAAVTWEVKETIHARSYAVRRDDR